MNHQSTVLIVQLVLCVFLGLLYYENQQSNFRLNLLMQQLSQLEATEKTKPFIKSTNASLAPVAVELNPCPDPNVSQLAKEIVSALSFNPSPSIKSSEILYPTSIEFDNEGGKQLLEVILANGYVSQNEVPQIHKALERMNNLHYIDALQKLSRALNTGELELEDGVILF